MAEKQRFKFFLSLTLEIAEIFIKKLVLAWEPDFTKVTAEEAKHIAAAESSGFVDEADIDWDNLAALQ